MPKGSPLFLFAVIITVAVAFIMVAGIAVQKTPTGGNYSQAGDPTNLTTGYIVGTIQQAPNWMIPAIFVMMAVFIIMILFMFSKKSR